MIRRLASMAAAVAPALWAGMILGGGFLAVPAIFAGPEAARPFAYAAAARVFERLALAEICFAVILAVALALLRFPRKRAIAGLMLIVLLAVQAIWLRPELLARADILAGGGAIEPSPAHAINAFLELCKLAWLIGLAFALREPADDHS